jgi:hypothetical protein
VVHALHEASLLVDVNVAGAQAEQTWSLVVVPAALMYVPAAQEVHGVQAVAFAAVENEPAVQGVHTWSLVALPAAETYVPGAHVVHATQGVEGLPSLSQVPAAQATAGLAFPAQYSPAVHGPQTGGDVGVAAAVCTEPAVQKPSVVQLP